MWVLHFSSKKGLHWQAFYINCLESAATYISKLGFIGSNNMTIRHLFSKWIVDIYTDTNKKKKKNWKHILAKSTSVSYRQVDVHENKFVKAIFWENQVRYSIHLRNNAAKSKNYKVYNVIVSWYYIYYCYFIFRLISIMWSIFCRMKYSFI